MDARKLLVALDAQLGIAGRVKPQGVLHRRVLGLLHKAGDAPLRTSSSMMPRDFASSRSTVMVAIVRSAPVSTCCVINSRKSIRYKLVAAQNEKVLKVMGQKCSRFLRTASAVP
jgi:hypothetical protein